MLELHKIWIEQCEAARGIEDEFGTDKALSYLVGEKFLNYLEAADRHADYRAELPAFVAEIKRIFERWQLAEYLETAHQTEPFDESLYEGEDPEVIEEAKQEDIHHCTRDLLLVERAREWLLEGERPLQ
jgi:hypothetical protein